MDMDKFIRKYRILVILGVLALAFLAIWFGMSGGQRTEIDFSPSNAGFRTGETPMPGEQGLKPLPFDGTEVMGIKE
jgi:hypothetical protein